MASVPGILGRLPNLSTVLLFVILVCTIVPVSVHGQRTSSSSSSSEETTTEFDTEAFTLAPVTSISKSVHEHVSTSSSFSTSLRSRLASNQRVNTNVPVPVPNQVPQQPVPVQVQNPIQEHQNASPGSERKSTHTTVELIEPLPVIPITIDVTLQPTDIISTIPPKSAPGQVLPVAEIYLAGVHDELTLLTNASNSEILIDRKYVFNGSEFINIVLVCTSSYPIRWIYKGDGAPARMYSSELRTFEDFHNPSSYEYYTTLVLMQERNNEHLTGTYTCEGTEYPNRGQVFYHLYFPGGYGFPTIRNRVISPPKNGTRVNLPCMATNPRLPMTLYKIYPKEEAANLTNHEAVSYDAKTGFTVDLSILRQPYGTYYCSVNDADSFWKIDLVPRKEDEVVVYPNTQTVAQSNFASQIFSCAAKEPVELTFPQSLEYGITSYYKNESSNFPYLGIYKIDANLPISALGKYFKINCVLKRTRRVLHTWEYSNIGAEELSIKFDTAQRRILCCSSSGLSTVQEIVKCETRTDCEIKKRCFVNGRCEYPFPPRFVDAPPGCTAMEFLERVPTHAIKCSVGQQAKIVTVVEGIERDDVLMVEEASDPAVPPTDLILKIDVLSQSANNDIRVKCSGSLYFFSTSLVLALENADGSFEYLNRDIIDISDPYEPVLLTRINRNTRRIHCFAPLAGSSEWRNVSVPVVASDVTTTTTTTARSLSRGFNSRGRTRLAG